jgi:hypothetical protein
VGVCPEEGVGVGVGVAVVSQMAKESIPPGRECGVASP